MAELGNGTSWGMVRAGDWYELGTGAAIELKGQRVRVKSVGNTIKTLSRAMSTPGPPKLNFLLRRSIF